MLGLDALTVSTNEQPEAYSMTELLGLPQEVLLNIISRLIPDPDFINQLLAFASTADYPNQLIKDFTIWQAVADHWLSEQHFPTLSKSKLAKILQMFAQAGREQLIDLLDPNYEHLYHVNGKALVAAGKAADTNSLNAFLNRLQNNPYPFYVGEALNAVCANGTYEQATLLLNALLRKNNHTRDTILRMACQSAVKNGKWDIVSLLLKQEACRKDSTLLGQVLLKAGKENEPKIVQQIVQENLASLSFMDKWAVKSMPGFRSSGLSVDSLFANEYWFVRTPIHYLAQPTPNEMDDVAELLASITLDDEPKRGGPRL